MLQGQAHHHPKGVGAGSLHPQLFVTSYMCAHGMRISNQICTVIKVNVRKIFAGSTRPLAKVFGVANADVQSVRGS